MSDFAKNFGLLVGSFRRAQGLSQAELARMINYRLSALPSFEAGERQMISVPLMKRFVVGLGIPQKKIEELMREDREGRDLSGNTIDRFLETSENKILENVKAIIFGFIPPFSAIDKEIRLEYNKMVFNLLNLFNVDRGMMFDLDPDIKTGNNADVAGITSGILSHLSENLDDYICTFEGVGSDSESDLVKKFRSDDFSVYLNYAAFYVNRPVDTGRPEVLYSTDQVIHYSNDRMKTDRENAVRALACARDDVEPE